MTRMHTSHASVQSWRCNRFRYSTSITDDYKANSRCNPLSPIRPTLPDPSSILQTSQPHASLPDCQTTRAPYTVPRCANGSATSRMPNPQHWQSAHWMSTQVRVTRGYTDDTEGTVVHTRMLILWTRTGLGYMRWAGVLRKQSPSAQIRRPVSRSCDTL